ncbi:UNVERIFIED_CONTAM: hypothetical protein RMT77_016632 [Armadillidium vulgare]
MEKSYNARCPAVKRLLKEAQELHEATEEYCAYPLEDNLFEWHFTVRGPPDTEFDGGIFHGRIMMPTEYPMKPPNIIFFTPNGRFETNKKICLSISGHHPEMWQPSWSIRTALLAIIGFMPTPANGTIGSLDYTAEERAILAKRSVDFECPECGRVADLVKERTGANEELQKEAKAVSSQMVVTGKENIPKEIPVENSPNIDSSELNPHGTDDISSSVETEQISQDEFSTLVEPSSVSQETNNESVPLQELTSSVFSPRLPNVDSPSSPSQTSTLCFFANNIILTAAVMLLAALVTRRLFLLSEDFSSSEDIEDALL